MHSSRLMVIDHLSLFYPLSLLTSNCLDLIFMERKAAFEARKQAKRIAKENAHAEKVDMSFRNSSF